MAHVNYSACACPILPSKQRLPLQVGGRTARDPGKDGMVAEADPCGLFPRLCAPWLVALVVAVGFRLSGASMCVRVLCLLQEQLKQ